MQIIKNETVLILGPHTDDAEFGCGGTIASLIENNCNVHIIAFSTAEESLPEGFAKDINRTNMMQSIKILGIDVRNVEILNYPVRHFPAHRQNILEDLVKKHNEIKPSIVFLPSSVDIHQDHQVISQEGLRAFKNTTVFGYELPWNNLSFSTTCFIKLDENHVSKKLESLKCYIAQMGRSYINAEYIRSVMRSRGGQIGGKYAETFEVSRLIYQC